MHWSFCLRGPHDLKRWRNLWQKKEKMSLHHYVIRTGSSSSIGIRNLHWLQRALANQVQEQRRSRRNTERNHNVKEDGKQHANRHLAGSKDPDAAEKGETRPDREDDEEDIEVSAQHIIRDRIRPFGG